MLFRSPGGAAAIGSQSQRALSHGLCARAASLYRLQVEMERRDSARGPSGGRCFLVGPFRSDARADAPLRREAFSSSLARAHAGLPALQLRFLATSCLAGACVAALAAGSRVLARPSNILAGKEGRKARAVPAHRPCKNTSGASSAWSQHACCLRGQKPEEPRPGPRPALLPRVASFGELAGCCPPLAIAEQPQMVSKGLLWGLELQETLLNLF